jgi:hypothetical protein
MEDMFILAVAEYPSPIVVLDDSGHPVERHRFPILDPVPTDYRAAPRLVEDPDNPNRWAALLMYGPVFSIWNGLEGEAHRYFDEVPYARPGTPENVAARRDTLTRGAIAGSIVEGEIYLLGGGRGRTRTDRQGAPADLIDVFGLDGGYRRSYRLPAHANDFATDGRLFVVSRQDPAEVVGLRPRL